MFEILLLAILGYGAFRLVSGRGHSGGGRGGGGGPEKCVGCSFNERSDPDGTLCSLGEKQVFKNRIQVSWCQNARY